MSARRELGLAVLLCLAGSALVLFGASQTWATLEPSTFGSVDRALSGDDLAGAAQSLGYVGLAAVVALAATKRWGRVIVGLLVLIAGLGIVIAVSQVLSDGLAQRALRQGTGPVSSSLLWPYVTLAGGVVMVLSGLLVAVRGPRWAALSSAYEAPSGRAVEPPVTDKGAWDALDRGEDPTDA